MKLVKVREGEYKGEVGNGVFLWVVKERGRWFWFLGGYDPEWGAWGTDNVGPFRTKREATADAEANYRELLDA